MSDILLANAYFYRFDAKQWRTRQPFPPYGTLCAAAMLREGGWSVSLFDTCLRHSPDEIIPILQTEKPRYLVLYDDDFNYLTKMCLTRMREAALDMVRHGRKAGCTVIVHGSDCTDHPDLYLSAGAHAVVTGEGEITLRELLSALDAGVTDLSAIQGLAYSAGAQLLRTAPRPVLQELDLLPDPAWDLADIEAYRNIWMPAHGYFSLNLATTRGCPFKCNWCAKPIYGNRYNSRSPERVAGEIEYLIRAYGVRHFWMADDIFGLKPGWVQRFRNVVQARGLSFQYKIQSRVDLLLESDNIDALTASGLREAWVGAESGAQKVLDAMDKGTTVAQIRESARLLQSKGVAVGFFLQFGYLGETWEDIRQTMRMVEELRPDNIGISVSYPLPGTKFHEKVRDLLGDKQNWSDSDDLAMLYPATFSPAFYRRLHRLVHKRFRLSQGAHAWRKLLSGQIGAWKTALRVLYYAPAAWLDRLRLQILAHGKI